MLFEEVVVGTGFEPVKAMPADLQSAPVGRLGIPPRVLALRAGHYATHRPGCQFVGKVLEIFGERLRSRQ